MNNNNTRHIEETLKNHFTKYKETLILLGSRQVGKTTLIKRLFPNAAYFLVDNEPIKKMLETYDIYTYKRFFKENSEIIIDEIHLLSDPGRAAKIIYDQTNTKLIITGSSSFHIKNKTSESLAGRKIDYHLFPLTFSEYLTQSNLEPSLNFELFETIINPNNSDQKTVHLYNMENVLQDILLFGQYPSMINHPQDKLYLQNFIDSLIFKDLLDLNLIENRSAALSLLKLLAYQIGNLINYSELASKLNIDQRTVKRYLDIFEQSFIIFRLYPYSQNPRDEIIKSPKIYFYDTGIRNALINDFSDLNVRPDKGALFENFVITECLKANTYLNTGFELNFWRNKQKSEVDLILKKENKLIAVEIKYKKEVANKAFLNRYPEGLLKTIHSGNL